MYKPHKSLTEVDNNARIWRYMDFAQLCSLMLRKELFFARVNTFEDPHEGIYPEANLDEDILRHEVVERIEKIKTGLEREGCNIDNTIETLTNSIIASIKNASKEREEYAASCWSIGEYDLDFLWKIYCGVNNGVAIRSTGKRMKSCFGNEPRNVVIGKVSYGNERIPEGNAFTVIFHKRTCYEYEKELRAVVWEDEPVPSNNNMKRLFVSDSGEFIKVDPNILIEKIYVSPYSACWFRDVVEAILQRIGYSLVVIRSELLDAPGL